MIDGNELEEIKRIKFKNLYKKDLKDKLIQEINKIQIWKKTKIHKKKLKICWKITQILSIFVSLLILYLL